MHMTFTAPALADIKQCLGGVYKGLPEQLVLLCFIAHILGQHQQATVTPITKSAPPCVAAAVACIAASALRPGSARSQVWLQGCAGTLYHVLQVVTAPFCWQSQPAIYHTACVWKQEHWSFNYAIGRAQTLLHDPGMGADELASQHELP